MLIFISFFFLILFNNLLDTIFDIIKLHTAIPESNIIKPTYSFVSSTQNQFLNIKQQPAKIATSVGSKIPLKILNGLDIFIISIKPVSTVSITHIVEYICDGNFKNIFNIKTITIFSITVNAVGIDLLITFPINLPFTLSLFGSNARINDGIPIHTSEIKLSCIGINGYSAFTNTNNIARIVEYIVFDKNNDADLSRLLIVRLPSATIFGIDAKFESRSTSCDTFLAASEPDAIAILHPLLLMQ